MEMLGHRVAVCSLSADTAKKSSKVVVPIIVLILRHSQDLKPDAQNFYNLEVNKLHIIVIFMLQC